MSLPGEVVAIFVDNKPYLYAKIEDIEPDIKPKWFRVTLLMLSFPPVEVTWILKEEYINGAEFTMDGVPVKISSLQSTKRNKDKKDAGRVHSSDRKKVLSLQELRNKKMNFKTE